ncbi:hypothetical protein LTR47_004080 [Exophiala xenobiotica]|nr:hypothetical protein LTR47_004080 [Exophiala xenobiotica]KAK5246733.1 hypothetical protein LTS06_007993 [Exophiala xenobiotica]KAK5326386.1 hypothetical protein LTR93_003248 [Exophiala xenobiotica]KAK5353076.1 hypothetical protein LTR61_003033 [Exophiala xenobiotica]KAK5379857.1 hypothetical protein LTR11_003485 [Exophiala xenobiotica]
MSWVGSLLLKYHNWWNNTDSIRTPILTQKTANLKSNNADFQPLRIGILGAADINFVAIIDPVSTHPTALITAIGARDKSRAQAQIDAYKSLLPGDVKAHGSYDAIVSDPDIDAVYIPLPNGLHHKWALAALRNGKHVLIEKPMASNAREAREIRDAAAAAGKVALEAFHWRFHPAAHTVKAMVLSGEYGPVRSVNAAMVLPAGILGQDDIRFQYSLGGGSSMDLTYVYSAAAYFAVRDVASDETEFEVLDAEPRLNKTDKLVDDAMRATILFKESPGNNSSSSTNTSGSGLETVTETETKTTNAVTSADLSFPKLFGLIPRMWATAMDVTIHCDKAEISFTNFVGPWMNHAIVVTRVTRDDTGKVTSRTTRQSKTQKCYKGGPLWERECENDGHGHGDDTNNQKVVGEEWWTTYRYQLEGFVRKICETESGGGYQYKGPFVSLDESVRIMEIIDAVYEKAGLPVRGQ